MIDLTGARGLTLQLPWGALIAHADKRIENRLWRPHRGVTRILIHSGKTWDLDATWPFLRGIRVVPSAVVAVADITGVCEASRHADTVRCGCGCGRWAMPGQYHWKLANVVTLAEPVACGGSRGLWPPPPVVIAAVAAQLEEASSR